MGNLTHRSATTKDKTVRHFLIVKDIQSKKLFHWIDEKVLVPPKKKITFCCENELSSNELTQGIGIYEVGKFKMGTYFCLARALVDKIIFTYVSSL